MSSTPDDGGPHLSPDDAFGVLGNETRMEILRTLGQADQPLSFSELRDRIGMADSGQFNYHLGQLEGHFVEKTDEVYRLRQPGKRVIQAVLSGAVTRDPALEIAEVDDRCYLCEASIMVDYQEESVGIFCTRCSGNFDIPEAALAERLGSEDLASELGFVGASALPPAGIQGRSTRETYRASLKWTLLEAFSNSVGICPRCSASVENHVEICETHDSSNGICDACGKRHAIQHHVNCTNCIYTRAGLISLYLIANPEFLKFLIDHGANPIAPSAPMEFWGYFTPDEEVIVSSDPFEAQFTFTIEGDTLILTVDDDLSVVDVQRDQGLESAE